MVEVATDTKKRKTSSNVADSDVENVTVSPVVRRTRRSRITQQVLLHMYWVVMWCNGLLGDRILFLLAQKPRKLQWQRKLCWR